MFKLVSIINIKREISATNGYGKEYKDMCMVTRVVMSFRAGYHNVKLNVVEQKYNTKKYTAKHTLQKNIHILHSYKWLLLIQ